MAQLVIELKLENTITRDGIIDWIPALKKASEEVQLLNTFAQEGTKFPRAIECNPSAMNWVDEQIDAMGGLNTPAHWEGSIDKFLGVINTPPTEDGMVLVSTNAYEWINTRYLPAMPTTFDIIVGIPKHAGTII